MIEVFFGGRHAWSLEAEGPGAFARYAIEELAGLLGSDIRRRLTPLAESRWGLELFSGGSYSHALPGHAGERAILAEPVDDRIFFAGEACSTHLFSTAHGAWITGVEAAQAVVASFRRSNR